MEAGQYFDTPRCRTVRRAAQDCGGIEELAHEMCADVPDVQHWMSGESLPPVALFLKVLDIVAQGPLFRVPSPPP